jgi:hypothetical protein
MDEVEGVRVPVGAIDVTMYRDDLRRQPTVLSGIPIYLQRWKAAPWCWSMMCSTPGARCEQRWTRLVILDGHAPFG